MKIHNEPRRESNPACNAVPQKNKWLYIFNSTIVLNHFNYVIIYNICNSNNYGSKVQIPERLHMFHQSPEQATDYKQWIEFITDIRDFKSEYFTNAFNILIYYKQHPDAHYLTLILRRSRTGTVWFYTSTSNKRAARPKLYTKSLTGDLKLMYSRLTLVRISINL